MSEFRLFKDTEAVAQAAADYIAGQINTCVDNKGVCHVVLPGGSTPARCLELLAEKTLSWQQIHWYPSDERCYPVGHSDRNDSMIQNRLFSSHVDILADYFHPIPAELGAEEGAVAYAELLDTVSMLDIVILGMGEDGHTASLFPGNAALHDTRSAVPVFNAPKPPADRISIGLNRLKGASECIMLATGENKKLAVRAVKQGSSLPVAVIDPEIWFIDKAADTGN